MPDDSYLQGRALNQNYASREEIIMKRIKVSIALTGLAAVLFLLTACSGSNAEVGTAVCPARDCGKRVGIVRWWASITQYH